MGLVTEGRLEIVEDDPPTHIRTTVYERILLAASTGCGLKLRFDDVMALAREGWVQWRAAMDAREHEEQLGLRRRRS